MIISKPDINLGILHICELNVERDTCFAPELSSEINSIIYASVCLSHLFLSNSIHTFSTETKLIIISDGIDNHLRDQHEKPAAEYKTLLL